MKTKVVILIDWYTPAFKAGGPVRSMQNLVNLLHDYFDFYIITSSFDVDKTLLNVPLDQWTKQGNAQVYYATNLTSALLKQLITSIEPGTVYINGMFSFKYSILPVIQSLFLKRHIPRWIIAPRGMLLKNARNEKRLKKTVFLGMMKHLGVYNKIDIWHTTSPEESKDLIQWYPVLSNKINEIPNLPFTFTDIQLKEKPANQLNMVFYARLARKKNLDYLLQILQEWDKNNWQLHIIGPIEDNRYFEECKTLINALNQSSSRVFYHGAMTLEDAAGIIQRAHLSVLPTKHENYAHTIIELLSLGLPSLISDNTPWKDLKQYNAGFVLSLYNKEAWINALNRFYEMPHHDWFKWHQNAKLYPFKKLNTGELKKQYIKLLEGSK